MTKANKFPLRALAAGIGLILAAQASAQTFTTLHSFTGGSDGANPETGLVLAGSTLYGTAENGAGALSGTVFAISTNGTGFATVYNFTGGSDGAAPEARLISSGNTLYGTAIYGGSWGNGTVFAVNTDGTGFTTLYSFTADAGSPPTNSDGARPYCKLILSGNTLYGTAPSGGSSGNGTVFAINTDGTGFATLYSFTADAGSPPTNSDGARPFGGLILSGNTLYGTALLGGSSGHGTVFAVNTDGTGFTTLYSFSNGSDGANPRAGLILSGNTLYGTAGGGGGSGHGTVFALNTDGTGFRTLYSFTGGSDGAGPSNGLILSGNTLYGTAGYGGSSSNGTVFAVNTDGTGYTTLHGFTAPIGPISTFGTNSDGGYPNCELILSGNTLYGTAALGGSSGNGTVFSLSLPPVSAPQLAITPSGANVILTWPATAAGFTLQSTTKFGSLAFWTTNSPAPVVVNGQNVVTNPIAGAQQFFRLSQ